MPVPGLHAPYVCVEPAILSSLAYTRYAAADKKPYRFGASDVFWSLAMACDVYLVVFYHYDAAALRKLEMKYIAAITLVLFIPALTLIFIRSPERGPVYNDATVSNPSLKQY